MKSATVAVSARKELVRGVAMATAILAVVELSGHLLYLATHGGTPLWRMRTPAFRYVSFTPHGS